MTQENVAEQRYEKYQSQQFKTYSEARQVAEFTFATLTGYAPSGGMDSDIWRVRVRARKAKAVFDVITYRRKGLLSKEQVLSLIEAPRVADVVENAQKPKKPRGKKARKAAANQE